MLNYHLYRAANMHSADYVCYLSSVTRRYYIEMAKHVMKPFHHVVDHRNSFCRAILCKRGLCRHAVSVSMCVCPSRSCILSKRINASSKLFSPSRGLFATAELLVSMPNVMAVLGRRFPNRVVECRVYKKSRF